MSTAPADALATATELVSADMQAVEDRLRDLVPEGLGGLTPVIYRHVLQSGGKRLRPLLTLLSCQAAGGDSAQAVSLAAAAEVLHLASLIHDDVIDEAASRRGRPSAASQWGNRAAVLAGDFLVARVFQSLSAELERMTLTILAQTVAHMCQAELVTTEPGAACLTAEQYRSNIQGKTGALMAAVCEIGALAAGNETAAPLLRRYGEHLGEAFQVRDDLLDLYGDEAVVGKPVLQDLRRGQWSLPVIQALEAAGADQRAELLRLLEAARDDSACARQAADLAAELGGVTRATDLAAMLVAEATAALDELPPTPAREALADLARYSLARQS